ncbi:uncharacterized protein LOC143644408 isoform X2 [Tamandua tetradactyla]|uniref:uncharacterized protein LOC143644408 isoform X2 n=1 Tax=Tamandua tetradactyla TaxID=48850 RepID=UPI0040541F4A
MASSNIGFGWSLWQRQQAKQVPTGFWFQLWTGAKLLYSPLRKQLCAAYNALLQVERLTQKCRVKLRIAILIQGARYWDLTVWMAMWKQEQWTVVCCPLWEKEIWEDICTTCHKQKNQTQDPQHPSQGLASDNTRDAAASSNNSNFQVKTITPKKKIPRKDGSKNVFCLSSVATLPANL